MLDRRSGRLARWVMLLAVAVGLTTAKLVLAQGDEATPAVGPARAAVVIQVQGRTDTYCVALPESGATGLDALQATGRDLNVMAGPLGAAVCRLEGQGCSYPAEHCFCQCQGASCRYWAYFFLNESGAWQYSGIGTAGRPLRDRAVEGWLWTDGSNQTPTGRLPTVTFDSICGADAQATTHPTAESVSGAGQSGPSGLDRAGLLVFGALIVAVGGLLWWKRIGRRSGNVR